MILNIIIWLTIITCVAVYDGIKPEGYYDSSFFDSKTYNMYMEKHDFLYATCHIIESMRNDAIGIEKYIDNFCEVTKRRANVSDKIFRALCIPIIKIVYKYRKHITFFSRMIALWSIICYKFIQTIFVIFLVTSLVSYALYRDYIKYMDTLHIVLFYLIPICVFLVAMTLEGLLLKMDWDWPLVKIAFITTFCISYPIAIINNDWDTAIKKYNAEMREYFGDDWEDETNEYRNEFRYDGRR